MRALLSTSRSAQTKARSSWVVEVIPAPGITSNPLSLEGLSPHARVAQEEIFGPVLGFIRAASFDHAIEIANCTDFGLTGSVYSRDRMRLELAKDKASRGKSLP